MKWIAGAGTVLALAGAGVFFALQGLDRADKFASIGSLLLALAVAGAGVVVHLRGRRPPETRDTTTTTNDIHDNGVVVTGPRSTVNVDIDRRERRPTLRWWG